MMSSRELETGLTLLRFSRHMVLELLGAIPADQWLHVPVESGNHATWIACHLAWEDDDTLKDLVEGRGSKLPQSWHDRVAQGTRPTVNPDDYPAHDEIRSALETLREELYGFFSASADRLSDALPEGVHGFVKDLAGLMPALACHEMVHVGQLTVIRKSLKLPPVFG